MKHHIPRIRELVHGTTPQLHPHRLHRPRHLSPLLVPQRRRRHRHRTRSENLHHLPQHVDHVHVTRPGPHALETRVAVTLLRRHVDRRVPLPIHAVHRVPARVEREVAHQRVGVNPVDPRQLRHFPPGRVPAFAVTGAAEKFSGEQGVEVGHADFQGVVVVVERVVGVSGGGEDVPGVGG